MFDLVLCGVITPRSVLMWESRQKVDLIVYWGECDGRGGAFTVLLASIPV